MMITALLALAAILFDWLLGEPRNWHKHPILGVEAKLKTNDIERALALVKHSVWQWLGFFFVIAGLTYA